MIVLAVFVFPSKYRVLKLDVRFNVGLKGSEPVPE